MMKKLTLDELIGRYSEDGQVALRMLADEPDTTGLVLFENQQANSREFGETTVVGVGPYHSYETVEECEGKWLNHRPSQRQYAVAYWKKEATQ